MGFSNGIHQPTYHEVCEVRKMLEEGKPSSAFDGLLAKISATFLINSYWF